MKEFHQQHQVLGTWLRGHHPRQLCLDCRGTPVHRARQRHRRGVADAATTRDGGGLLRPAVFGFDESLNDEV